MLDIESLAIQHPETARDEHARDARRQVMLTKRPDLSAAGLGVFGNRFVPACITQKFR